jgi:hypothetical protein
MSLKKTYFTLIRKDKVNCEARESALGQKSSLPKKKIKDKKIYII